MSLFNAEEYKESTAVNSKMSLSRIAAWNEAVRTWMWWFVGGGGSLKVKVEVGEAGRRPSLLLMASSRLRTWSLGERQIEQSCCAHRDVRVQILSGSWRGVSISVMMLRSSSGSIFFVSRK